MTGWIEFRVKGQPGDKAELNCFEVLDADGNVKFTINPSADENHAVAAEA